ncbi:MAG: nucleotidyltransferase domain-containing protein [Nitrospinae bacterium]|nr:nucleotidyltransferase domain-containing protein [Nitrospinota bacterium]
MALGRGGQKRGHERRAEERSGNGFIHRCPPRRPESWKGDEKSNRLRAPRRFPFYIISLKPEFQYSLVVDALVERVTNRIAEAIHPDKIILFGSRANGTATEESDIDLVVVYSGPKTTREVHRLFLRRDFRRAGACLSA